MTEHIAETSQHAEHKSDRRLIEETLPVYDISKEAVREKAIRHGHISTLHIWWARRPLIACRAAVFASLIRNPDNPAERRSLIEFLTRFCKWEESNDSRMIEQARRLILEHNNGKVPKVLDSFAGGGAIPLEALRVGCETHSLDLNPVANIIQLCTLVYPQKYGKPFETITRQKNVQGESKTVIPNRLAYDVERWGKWVIEQARADIGKYYATEPEGSVPLAYLWARTVKCPNPTCGAEIPLLKQLWLANSKDRKIALRMTPIKNKKSVKFEIIEGNSIDFDPSKGTVRLGSVECPVCQQAAFNKSAIKKIAREKGMGVRPLAVVMRDKSGRHYKLFDRIDTESVIKATKSYERLANERIGKLPVVPNELISTDYDWVLKPPMFGLTKWSDIFSPRQALALVTFTKKVREAYEMIISESGDKEYAKVVLTYLALVIDRLADYLSTVCVWAVSGEFVAHTFGRQAIPMAWDYCEVNPFSGATGDFGGAIEWVLRVIENCSVIGSAAIVRQGTATQLPYPNAYFDAVIIDPPYYDAVPYADLSDFFYVWLKRSCGDLYPELFATPLTPKNDELVEQSDKVASASRRKKDKNFYESGLSKALAEANRVLTPDGICVIAFAHKTTTAWEALIGAILRAGLHVTASWPLHTEMQARLRAHGSAALSSSVWLVCRKRMIGAGVGSWKSVQAELNTSVKTRLDYFLGQGIKGADALLSAIGPALEVFGKYERVEKVTGETVTICEFLDKVREVVAHHALATVLSEQELGVVDPPTAFYVLWKWTFEQIPTAEPKSSNGTKALVPFDDALKLARAVGIEIEALLKTYKLLKQEKESVRLLGPADRKEILGGSLDARNSTPPAVIDMIHKAMILWASQATGRLAEYLETSGAQDNVTFWRVAQALSNLLPMDSKEKQLLDGLLTQNSGITTDARRNGSNTRLDEFGMGTN